MKLTQQQEEELAWCINYHDVIVTTVGGGGAAAMHIGQLLDIIDTLQRPDAAPEPSAAATAPFEIGDHVKHHDGTTGQVVGISCESGWLHVLWDNSRACLWWSPVATTLLDDETPAPTYPTPDPRQFEWREYDKPQGRKRGDWFPRESEEGGDGQQ